jgi:pyruvate kinase
MPTSDRKTKIVCTIGPSSNTPEKIESLVLAGMNVARLNFSHGSHEDHKSVIDAIRQVEEKMGRTIGILMDLQGPKIRVGTMLEGGQIITAGVEVILSPEKVLGTSEIIPIDYPNLVKDAKVGDTILMDDGLLECRITEKKGSLVKAMVVVGGLLKSRKGVNLPNVKISISAITEKDFEDLDFGLSQGVDIVALSFVRSARDVQDLISHVRAKGSNAAIVAKIEKPEAIPVIDEIIEEADGIMVARGDLGIEIPSDQVPLIQKHIIRRCRQLGKPVITATQMLESMISNPRPTRAESSDVANAVLDGTDAIMLSGESASGKYPIEAVRVMDRICRSVEAESDTIYQSLTFKKPDWKEKQVIEALSYSCVKLAEDVNASVIATITHSGTTARRIAKYRPHVPIVAFTENEVVARQLNLVWGVHSVKINALYDTDQSIERMERYLHEHGWTQKGDRAILATGVPTAKKGRTNMIKVSTLDS